MNTKSLSLLLVTIVLCNLNFAQENKNFDDRAKNTMATIYAKYGNDKNNLLVEKYPFDDKFKADYLHNSAQAEQPKKYAYLWPYSGSLSAINALMELPKQIQIYQPIVDNTVIIGLREYRDDKRSPVGYASYINDAPMSDRFYDDNVWLGIDFTDLYLQTKNPKYLKDALEIWTFVKSGEDEKLGGGIYWCEQKKESKNTCSNAPAAVFALKLYQATKDKYYLDEGQRLYEWTKSHLEDPTDKLYWDNIKLNGDIDKAKYSYNSGQMLQAAAILYKITKQKKYLTEAQHLAESCLKYFFHQDATKEFPLLKNSNLWFHAVMLRGYISLFEIDGNKQYLDAYAKNLDYAWDKMRDENGLFEEDWTLKKKQSSKWLLDQCAFVEIYARLAKLGY